MLPAFSSFTVAFTDHGDSSYYGMGPWILHHGRSREGLGEGFILRLAPGGFSYAKPAEPAELNLVTDSLVNLAIISD